MRFALRTEGEHHLFQRLLRGGLKLGGGFLLWFLVLLGTIIGLETFMQELGGDTLTGDALPPEFPFVVASHLQGGTLSSLVLITGGQLNDFHKQNESRNYSFLLPKTKGEFYEERPAGGEVQYKAANLPDGRQRISLKIWGTVEDVTVARYEAEEKRVHPKYYFRGHDFQMFMMAFFFGFPLSLAITYLLLRGAPAVYRVMRKRN